MKEYIQRLRDNCSVRTFAFWWLIRLCMIFYIVKSMFDKPFDPVMTTELIMNFGLMFAWEMCLAMPKWTVFRYMLPMSQTGIIIFDFIAATTAYVFNFYYEVRWWDSFLHFTMAIGLVILGYEFAGALIIKERKNAPLPMMILASAGFSFMCTVLWELFEFSADQVVGIASGEVANSQFWSYERLLGTDKVQTILSYIDINRYPIMDTMGDTIMNGSGALLGALALIIYPYRHKGKYKLDFLSE